MTFQEVEAKIQKINDSKFIKELKLSFDLSKDENECWNDLWLIHVGKYLTDDRIIKTELDIFPEVAKEIIEFAHWSERTYASVVYDFIRKIIIASDEPDLKDIEDWDDATKYFDNIAIEVDNDWPNIVDQFDAFTLSELEDFFKVGFELINHPTYDSLIGINKNDKRIFEMQYIMSVGLFTVYESWMGSNG